MGTLCNVKGCKSNYDFMCFAAMIKIDDSGLCISRVNKDNELKPKEGLEPVTNE